MTDGIATITLNRPGARNAFTAEMIRPFHEAAVRAAEDPAVRAIAVTGAGGHFCAGADVKRFVAARRAGGEGEAALLLKEVTLYFHGAGWPQTRAHGRIQPRRIIRYWERISVVA